MSKTPTIIYTYTDEAPALATASFLPIIQAYAKTAGVHVETRDISLSGRILATFPFHRFNGCFRGDTRICDQCIQFLGG